MSKKNLIPEHEKKIMNVFNIRDPSKMPSCSNKAMRTYFCFLTKNLTFPIKGYFEEETVPMQMEGCPVVLNNLNEDYDYHYGILAEGKMGGKKVVVPLVDFSLESEDDENFQIIDDYKTWFSNWR